MLRSGFLSILFSGMGATAAQAAPPAGGSGAEVLQAEGAFRVAKLKNDTAALKSLLADGYIGINQYGVIRNKANKAELIELFQTFQLTLLHSDLWQIGTGEQHSEN